VGIVAVGTTAVAAIVGTFVAGAWAAAGWLLGRRHDGNADHPTAAGQREATG
jgi:hypothetical protein